MRFYTRPEMYQSKSEKRSKRRGRNAKRRRTPVDRAYQKPILSIHLRSSGTGKPSPYSSWLIQTRLPDHFVAPIGQRVVVLLDAESHRHDYDVKISGGSNGEARPTMSAMLRKRPSAVNRVKSRRPLVQQCQLGYAVEYRTRLRPAAPEIGSFSNDGRRIQTHFPGRP